MLKRFLVILLVLCLLVVPVVAQFQVGGGFQISGYAESQQDGDYSGWLYYKILHVTGNTSNLPVGFQVNFTCWYGVGADSANNVFLMEHSNFTDMHDLRFVDGDGWELDCWNESTEVGVCVDVWVELQSSLTVYVYYGNGLAPVVWDSSAVFERVIDDNVVMVLPLDGNANDYSGNGHSGVVTGATWVTDGRFGGGLDFDGDQDYVTVAGDSDFDVSELSVGVWFNPDVKGVDQRLVDVASCGKGQLVIWAANSLNWYVKVASGNKLAVDSNNTWSAGSEQVVFGTFDAAQDSRIFVNGSQSGSYDVNEVLDSSVLDEVVGAYSGDVSVQEFAGRISFLLYMNRSLTSGEALDLALYYPQCFGNHLGSLYLREWVVGGADVGVFGYEMGEVADVTEANWVAVVVFLVLGLVGFALMFVCRVAVVNVLYGGVLMASVGVFEVGQLAGSVPFNAYIMLFVFIGGLGCLLRGVAVARG